MFPRTKLRMQDCARNSRQGLDNERKAVGQLVARGVRIIARKMDNRVKLYSRLGNDLTQRFPVRYHPGL
jgi:hypothetical protein